jgi:hypothetical protein
MKAEFFLVTYAKDYDFTAYTLQSIDKFAKGFAGVTIVVPWNDEGKFRQLADKHHCNLRSYFESESKGFLHHQVCKCEADLWCPKDRDLIVHIDADCVFKEHFHLSDFISVSGKPFLVRERFDDFRHYAARYSWRQCAEHALQTPVEWEYMVRHPSIFHRGMYAEMRAYIERVHHYPFTQYVLLQRNEFPQTFAEFPTLGAYAAGFWKGRYDVVTRVRTPCDWWAQHGITPLPKDAKGMPIGDADLTLYGEELHRGSPLKDPVHYFWSRAGVTPKIRGEIQRIFDT